MVPSISSIPTLGVSIVRRDGKRGLCQETRETEGSQVEQHLLLPVFKVGSREFRWLFTMSRSSRNGRHGIQRSSRHIQKVYRKFRLAIVNYSVGILDMYNQQQQYIVEARKISFFRKTKLPVYKVLYVMAIVPKIQRLKQSSNWSTPVTSNRRTKTRNNFQVLKEKDATICVNSNINSDECWRN